MEEFKFRPETIQRDGMNLIAKKGNFKMSKFFGAIGYSVSEEKAPGVWTDNIVEHNHYGDVNRSKAQHETGTSLNDNLNISNEFIFCTES